MKNIKKNFTLIQLKPILFVILMCIQISYAETKIILKNGKEFEGDIIKETEKYLIIDTEGTHLTIYKNSISKVEGGNLNTNQSGNNEFNSYRDELDENKKSIVNKDSSKSEFIQTKKEVERDTIQYFESTKDDYYYPHDYFVFKGEQYKLKNRNLMKIHSLIPCPKAREFITKNRTRFWVSSCITLFLSPLAGFFTSLSFDKQGWGKKAQREAITHFNNCIRDSEIYRPFEFVKSKNSFIISTGWNLSFFKKRQYIGPELEFGFKHINHLFGINGQFNWLINNDEYSGYYYGGGLLYFYEGLNYKEYISLSPGINIGYWQHWSIKNFTPDSINTGGYSYSFFGSPKVRIKLGFPSFHISSTYSFFIGTTYLHCISANLNFNIRKTKVQYIKQNIQ